MSDLIPLVATVAFFVSSIITLRMILGHRERIKGMAATKLGSAPSDVRLARMEQAVEAIAIEIERVSEGQRFVTKLLNDRAQSLVGDVAKPVPVRRVDTPH